MQMLGNAELLTAAKYWHQWIDPRLVVLVLNNRELNFVTWEQRATIGDAKFTASQELPDFPYARYAELLGFTGIRVDSPDQVAGAWESALSADRPVVYEAIVDPNVPPLPPHITFDQAKAMMRAIYRGDPDAADVIRQSLRELVSGRVPHPG
jgi:pyruvate dehydrogenase (quinone)